MFQQRKGYLGVPYPVVRCPVPTLAHILSRPGAALQSRALGVSHPALALGSHHQGLEVDIGEVTH